MRLRRSPRGPELTDGGSGHESVAFLSPEWFERFAAALAAAGELPGDGTLRLGQVVTGSDGTTVAEWTVVLEGGRPGRVEPGPTTGADVVLVEEYGAALELARGATTAGALLETGSVKIRGDARRLLGSAALVEALSKTLEALSRNCHISQRRS